MSTASAASGLHLYHDGKGSVWFRDRVGVTSYAAPDLDRFVETSVDRHGGPAVHVVGCPENAALLETLHRLRPGRRVLVFSARGVSRLPDRHLRMLATDGSWPCYELNDAAAAAYAFAAGRGPLGEHPAYPAVSFVRGGDLDAAGDLLREILDPLAFRDPSRPNRVNRLYAYLGVRPDVADGTRRGRYASRLSLVLRAWRGSPCSPCPNAPRGFLWREHGRAAEGRGLVAASRRYVRFVAEVWMQAVYGPSVHAFDPEVFFARDEGLAALYRLHLRKPS